MATLKCVFFGFLEEVADVLVKLFATSARLVLFLISFSALVFIVMTPWDSLVWLLRTDWRTTHFQASFISLGCFLLFWVLLKLLDLLVQRAELVAVFCTKARMRLQGKLA